jgi:hypothetical protein
LAAKLLSTDLTNDADHVAMQAFPGARAADVVIVERDAGTSQTLARRRTEKACRKLCAALITPGDMPNLWTRRPMMS